MDPGAVQRGPRSDGEALETDERREAADLLLAWLVSGDLDLSCLEPELELELELELRSWRWRACLWLLSRRER